MEAVILCGVQASGKTRFYRDRLLDTHVRISRDLLRTAHRERRFLELCLETGQRFAVDKTNATPATAAPTSRPRATRASPSSATCSRSRRATRSPATPAGTRPGASSLSIHADLRAAESC